jgi:hypothetical protein
MKIFKLHETKPEEHYGSELSVFFVYTDRA